MRVLALYSLPPGNSYVLDVNPNPELDPGIGICRAVQEAGWTWERFVLQQAEWA